MKKRKSARAVKMKQLKKTVKKGVLITARASEMRLRPQFPGEKTSKPGTLTVEKRARFLELYKEGYTVTACAAAIDVSTCAIYTLKRRDEEFAKAFAEAREICADHIEDRLYSVSMDPGHNGFIPASIFLLKGLRPQVWRDGPQVINNNNNNLALISGLNQAMERSLIDGG